MGHVYDISISYLTVTPAWSHLFNGTTVLLKSIFAFKLVRNRDIIHVTHATLALSKIQYVHASNLGTQVRCFEKCIHSLWTWYECEYRRHKRWQIIDIRSTGISFSSLFLLTDIYFVIIIFSEQGWLRMASVWPSDAFPCIIQNSVCPRF
jgi:hypothetical protein